MQRKHRNYELGMIASITPAAIEPHWICSKEMNCNSPAVITCVSREANTKAKTKWFQA